MAATANSYAAHNIPTTPLSSTIRERGSSFKESTLLPNGMASSEFTSIPSHPIATSPLAQSFQQSKGAAVGGLRDDGLEDRRPSISQFDSPGLQRTASTTSIGGTSSRSNTLRKQKSLSRRGSLKRSNSRRSVRAGSIGGITYDDTSGVDFGSVFYTPIPTSGSPTEILANRFQAWRKLLKDIINYFREVQSSYEARAKSLSKVSNTIQHLAPPGIFMSSGGLNEATNILRDHHKKAVADATKSREIENDVIAQLSGLRADLAQKIKEIKNLSGDFKNSVEKEKEGTKKAVNHLQEALAAIDSESHALVGKDDPYIIRMAVDRQIERQIDEENYLQRAYLNLEGSGRELESIVVGEIQKAYNAFATILKKEADDTHETVEQLRSGPISIPKDLEWTEFVERDPHFVSPNTPLRRVEDLEYPGKFHPAAAEVRAGMLERKSKYLKSYTPGWYVLSPTHLHEFKSADGLYTQSPVMSLYLIDQKLGSHSQPGSSSHKFILKGRQTGGMHRGHSWVFRAESYDTMLAWYDAIKVLTEKTGEARNDFVRHHARSISRNSTISASSLEEDEADKIPYSGVSSLMNGATPALQESRPQPGGRFPSDVQVTNLPARLSPSSDEAEFHHEITSAASGLQRAPSSTTGEREIYNNPGSQGPNPYYGPTGGYQAHHDALSSTGDLGSLKDETWMTSVIAAAPVKEEESRGITNTVPVASVPAAENPWQRAEAPKHAIPGTVAPAAQPVNPIQDRLSGITITPEVASGGTTSAKGVSNDDGMAGNFERTVSPVMSRKDTDTSVSNLHVPGEFPRGISS